MYAICTCMEVEPYETPSPQTLKTSPPNSFVENLKPRDSIIP